MERRAPAPPQWQHYVHCCRGCSTAGQSNRTENLQALVPYALFVVMNNRYRLSFAISCSIGVVSPNGCIIASSSRAQAGPASILLHAQSTSCMGIALSKRQNLQSKVHGATMTVLGALSDVIHMLHTAPDCTHLLCLPFDPQDDSIGMKGALLLGFSADPALSVRSLRGISALCSLISRCLLRTAPPVLCTVETVLGSHSGCDHCEASSDDEVDTLFDDSDDVCRPSSGPGPSGDNRPPSQPLLLAIPEENLCVECDEASGSDGHNATESTRSAEHAGGSVGESSIGEGGSCNEHKGLLKPPQRLDARPYKFPKFVLFGLTSSDLIRHPVWLRYDNPALEGEFSRWNKERQMVLDPAYVMVGLIPLAFQNAPLHALLLPPMLLLAVIAMLGAFHRWRDAIRAAMRLYMVVALAMVGWKAPVSGMSATGVACGFDALILPAFGLPLRVAWHLPVQILALMVQLLRIMASCAGNGWRPHTTLALAVLMGLVLPTAILRVTERESRDLFEAHVWSSVQLEGHMAD